MQEWQQIRLVNRHDSGKTLCGKDWSWTRKMDDFDLWYVLEGEGEIMINGECSPVHEGVCCIFRPGDRVQAYQNPDKRMTQIFIHFEAVDTRTGETLSDIPSFPPRLNIVRERYWLEQYLHSMLEIVDEDDEFCHELFQHLMKAVLTKLLYFQHKEENELRFRQRHLMKKLILHIHNHIRRPIRHEELASLVSLSPRYVSRLFKEYTGKSIKEYIKQARLNTARRLLTETDKNVTQVADALGYKDIYLFSNQFKQQYGVSPLHYRSNMRRAKVTNSPIQR